MKQLRSGAYAVLALGLALLTAATAASATTLEIGGVAKNASVTFKASLHSGSSTVLTDTSGFIANTCTGSTIEGKTEGSFSGGIVGGKLSVLTFKPCTREEIVVDTPGSLTFTHVAGTTNATVRSLSAKWTVPSPFGTLTCVTASGEGTDIGTLTGVKGGTASLDLNVVLNCSIMTVKWEVDYTLTSPEGLGISS